LHKIQAVVGERVREFFLANEFGEYAHQVNALDLDLLKEYFKIRILEK